MCSTQIPCWPPTPPGADSISEDCKTECGKQNSTWTYLNYSHQEMPKHPLQLPLVLHSKIGRGKIQVLRGAPSAKTPQFAQPKPLPRCRAAFNFYVPWPLAHKNPLGLPQKKWVARWIDFKCRSRYSTSTGLCLKMFKVKACAPWCEHDVWTCGMAIHPTWEIRMSRSLNSCWCWYDHPPPPPLNR